MDSFKSQEHLVLRIWYHYLSNRPYRQEMIAWALTCLQAGLDSQSLRLLASAYHEEDREVVHLFQDAARELNILLPALETFDWIEKLICLEILNDSVKPIAGLKSLYKLWQQAGMNETFINWVYLDDSIDLLKDGYSPLEPFQTMTLTTISESIRNEAKRVLSNKNREEVH